MRLRLQYSIRSGIEKVPVEFVAKPESKVQEHLQPASQSTLPFP